MCTPISPAKSLCEDCAETYLEGHTPGDLTHEQVEECDDINILIVWASRCGETKYDVPQLCPAHAAKEKHWWITEGEELNARLHEEYTHRLDEQGVNGYEL